MKKPMHIAALGVRLLVVLALAATCAAPAGRGQVGMTPPAAAAGGNPSASLDQCANGPLSPLTAQACNPNEWVNGNLGSSKAHYAEGESIPYRIRFDSLIAGSTHTVTIEWDTTKSGKHALDYLTSFDRTVDTANPCAGVSGCGAPTTPTTYPIPADGQVTSAGVTPVSGNFTLFGGTITSVSPYSYANGTGFAGDKSARISITFTASVANPVLAWGGHISTRLDWSDSSSAVAITGSPYHMRVIDLDGSGGNQDRSLSAAAVVFPGSITIIKDAVPNDAQDFGFTTTGGLTPATFTLDDDADPTRSNTQVYSGITNFTTYTITEAATPGWALSFGTPVCAMTSPNGGTQTASASTVTIDLKEGENVTCKFTNTRQAAYLTVVKHVVNDNGGTATAADFTMSVTGTNVSPSTSFPGAESPGTTVTLNPGAYSVTESGPSGYTPGFSADCAGSIAAGQTKTCTITNDDKPATLAVVKKVTNDNGGTKGADAFSFSVNGGAPVAFKADGQNPLAGQNVLTVKAGAYSVTEPAAAGYAASLSADCSGTIANGETKICTITNDDIAPSLTVVKTVDAAVVNMGSQIGFGITVTNTSAFQANAVTLDDTLPPGTGLSWSIDGGSGAAFCTIVSNTLSCNYGNMLAGASLAVHVTSPTTASSAGTYTNPAKARSGGNPPVTSNEVSVTVKSYKIIVITCETTGNTNVSLVQSRVSLDGATPQFTLASGDNALCNTGGAVFTQLPAGTYSPTVEVPAPSAP